MVGRPVTPLGFGGLSCASAVGVGGRAMSASIPGPLTVCPSPATCSAGFRAWICHPGPWLLSVGQRRLAPSLRPPHSTPLCLGPSFVISLSFPPPSSGAPPPRAASPVPGQASHVHPAPPICPVIAAVPSPALPLLQTPTPPALGTPRESDGASGGRRKWTSGDTSGGVRQSVALGNGLEPPAISPLGATALPSVKWVCRSAPSQRCWWGI